MTRAILDELLVLRSQDGCADAFNQLLARWHGAVLRHAARIAGNDAARDVAQEAWAVVVRQLGRLEDPARFAGWLLRIVAGVAVDAVRARTRRGRAEAAATARAMRTRPRLLSAIRPTLVSGCAMRSRHCRRTSASRWNSSTSKS
jgi:DNA-directed RNA polymerase specialized sigma24 family protein